MYIKDGIAYADNFNNKDLKVTDFKIVSELNMIITFSNGEKRIFDAKYLTKYEVYKELEDYNTFKTARIEKGVIVWKNGEIDIGIEELYKNSYIYENNE